MAHDPEKLEFGKLSQMHCSQRYGPLAIRHSRGDHGLGDEWPPLSF